MNKIFKVSLTKTMLGLVGLIAFTSLTNPNRLPLVLTPLLFILLYIFLSGLIEISIMKLAPNVIAKRRVWTAAFISGFVVLLLVLRSLNQLTPIDVLLAALLGVLGLFYRSFSKT